MPPLVSVIISSYNYAQFLPDAIDSALNQDYDDLEVIVVDDGSVDDSRAIIAAYGNRIISVLKDNAGQASAFNSGFRESQGETILFLDSDDTLLPGALQTIVRHFDHDETAKVQWPLWEIDNSGRRTGKTIPNRPLSQGDFRTAVIENGPDGYSWPPTSGNAWARSFIQHIFPMPEREFVTCPDLYLSALAPLFGSVRAILEPQSCWRAHQIEGPWRADGINNTQAHTFDQWVKSEVLREDRLLEAIDEHRRQIGIELDPNSRTVETWRRGLWHSLQEIDTIIPPSEDFILVDQDSWAAHGMVAGRHAIPFLERNGQYWGHPSDDAEAIRELERMRDEGAHFIVFAWPAFWWFDYYRDFFTYLHRRYQRVLDNSRLVAFDMRVGGRSD